MSLVSPYTVVIPIAMIMHGSLSATAPVILAPDVTGAARDRETACCHRSATTLVYRG